MISNRYKKEIWYKFIEEKYPKVAKKLNEGYINMESQPHNACNSLRILYEDIVHIIGERENQKSLLKAKKMKKNARESFFYPILGRFRSNS